MLRAATHADVIMLPDIERAAGELFRPLGMAAVADDEPLGAADLRRYVDAGHAWVAQIGDQLAGYLILDMIDGCAHIEQVSVHPGHSRRGIGRQLIELVALWASSRGVGALTLTTYRDVAWNGPYYRRLGFRWLTDEQLTPGLRVIRQHEIERGLDRWPRGCMQRDLPAPAGRSGYGRGET